MRAPRWGSGSTNILEAIVQRIPAPAKPKDETLRALVFDSVFDVYRGVVAYVRVFSGQHGADSADQADEHRLALRGERGRRLHPENVRRSRRCTPAMSVTSSRTSRRTAEIKIGDTITDLRHSAKEPLPGFQEIHPMVFSGIYPINTADFEHLKTAIGKLRLNDSAFVYQPESSVALGFGFRCGFLGLLHMEIIQERLRREYDMDIIATSPERDL